LYDKLKYGTYFKLVNSAGIAFNLLRDILSSRKEDIKHNSLGREYNKLFDSLRLMHFYTNYY